MGIELERLIECFGDMKEFILSPYEQFFSSTAEDERNYFTGEQEPPPLQFNPNVILPSGNYRVINGNLYRIIKGLPPDIPLKVALK